MCSWAISWQKCSVYVYVCVYVRETGRGGIIAPMAVSDSWLHSFSALSITPIDWSDRDNSSTEGPFLQMILVCVKLKKNDQNTSF